ncbi:MAG: hypothetical protein M1819_002517 [Sarea resinae]|nr:MAG: hypothetical protein M1819_002517 [Sarea resinae]
MASVEEKALTISPLVPENIQHNALTLSQLRSLTASLFGIAAGVLGLESYAGFLFYFAGSLVVSGLLYAFSAERDPKAYFYGGVRELVEKDVVAGLSGYVLTWTLVFGVVRA